MRYKTTYLKHGNTRVRSFFALFPVTVWYKHHRETRWLERVTVQYVYKVHERDCNEWVKESFL